MGSARAPGRNDNLSLFLYFNRWVCRPVDAISARRGEPDEGHDGQHLNMQSPHPPAFFGRDMESQGNMPRAGYEALFRPLPRGWIQRSTSPKGRGPNRNVLPSPMSCCQIAIPPKHSAGPGTKPSRYHVSLWAPTLEVGHRGLMSREFAPDLQPWPTNPRFLCSRHLIRPEASGLHEDEEPRLPRSEDKPRLEINSGMLRYLISANNYYLGTRVPSQPRSIEQLHSLCVVDAGCVLPQHQLPTSKCWFSHRAPSPWSSPPFANMSSGRMPGSYFSWG